VRALAQLAGVSGQVSVRELLGLLGPAQYGPRPFYVIGHNTNTIGEVWAAINAGANALEVDVTAYENAPNNLCVAHRGPFSGDEPGEPADPPLIDYLKELRQVADLRPNQLALVIFDCKSPAATATLGAVLLDAIRTYLVDESNPVNVIISTASIVNSVMFDSIATGLRPRERLMIDEESQPVDVANCFASKGLQHPQCYGNGSSFSEEGASTYRVPIEVACWIRAQRAGFHFVYAWTVNDTEDQTEYLRIGVDGMIADTITQLHALVQSLGQLVRVASRPDNPFMPPNAAYALLVQTGDDGTDANVTFTLQGVRGSTSIYVDAGWNSRLEAGDTTCLVMQSQDLGPLIQISVQSDRTGNAPDWYLQTIRVESARYGVTQQAIFNQLIGSTALVSATL